VAGSCGWFQPARTDEEITMKAIVQDRYGGPEALELTEIDRPPLGTAMRSSLCTRRRSTSAI
jgi:hypothetical protein